MSILEGVNTTTYSVDGYPVVSIFNEDAFLLATSPDALATMFLTPGVEAPRMHDEERGLAEPGYYYTWQPRELPPELDFLQPPMLVRPAWFQNLLYPFRISVTDTPIWVRLQDVSPVCAISTCKTRRPEYYLGLGASRIVYRTEYEEPALALLKENVHVLIEEDLQPDLANGTGAGYVYRQQFAPDTDDILLALLQDAVLYSPHKNTYPVWVPGFKHLMQVRLEDLFIPMKWR